MEIFGTPYPIEKNPRGFLHSQRGVSQVKSDLLVLLLTNPGERVMLPEFGTPLRNLMFEPNDGQIESQAREMIINSIKLWEPRIVVSAIEVSSSIDEDDLHAQDTGTEKDHILSIKIMFFDPENIKQIQELKLNVPLDAGLG
jgi:hypothetical protein|tara:strand:+ start:79 stop:504 length:426 start_codon:yes stop_codon:yes gene_type:complete